MTKKHLHEVHCQAQLAANTASQSTLHVFRIPALCGRPTSRLYFRLRQIVSLKQWLVDSV